MLFSEAWFISPCLWLPLAMASCLLLPSSIQPVPSIEASGSPNYAVSQSLRARHVRLPRVACTTPLPLTTFTTGLQKQRSLTLWNCTPPWARGTAARTLRLTVSAASSKSESEREEVRWLREEERWLREEARWERNEQRWLREEARWQKERQQLLQEIDTLRQALLAATSARGAPSGSPTAIDVEVLLRSLGAGSGGAVSSANAGAITQVLAGVLSPEAGAASGVAAAQAPTLLPHSSDAPPVAAPSVDVPTPVVSASASRPAASAAPAAPLAAPAPTSKHSDRSTAADAPKPSTVAAEEKKRRTLRVGADGDDVVELQTALSLQGFYCGEEEMEFAMFADGTESAVKTWQATMRLKEDGIMTPELMALLIGDTEEVSGSSAQAAQAAGAAASVTSSAAQKQEAPSSAKSEQKEQQPASDNRNAPKATRERPEIERYARTSIEMGEHRVYLLGENRWEDPSRLQRNSSSSSSIISGSSTAGSVVGEATVNGRVDVALVQTLAGKKSSGMKAVVKQCFQCRGEGSMACMECEGTGDLNIEEQFLDWVGEDARCVYCDGFGAVVCDACDGTGEGEG